MSSEPQIFQLIVTWNLTGGRSPLYRAPLNQVHHGSFRWQPSKKIDKIEYKMWYQRDCGDCLNPGFFSQPCQQRILMITHDAKRKRNLFSNLMHENNAGFMCSSDEVSLQMIIKIGLTLGETSTVIFWWFLQCTYIAFELLFSHSQGCRCFHSCLMFHIIPGFPYFSSVNSSQLKFLSWNLASAWKVWKAVNKEGEINNALTHELTVEWVRSARHS